MPNNQQIEEFTAPRLFLFCIGGTGARVLKSLMFLLASGVDVKASSIVPIIIDPDRSNGDVTRTISVIDSYQKVREYLQSSGFKDSKFFKTNIRTLSSLDNQNEDEEDLVNAREGYRFGMDGTQEGKFRDFIGHGQLNEASRLLADLLFTENELNEDLDVGFKGRPHMGSIVLNRFSDSEDFKLFASRITEKDRIFIVSSIFGGTGAAGFPLLVKNIRQPKSNLQRPKTLVESRVGAVTVLPYFGIKPEPTSSIDAGTFMSKTKAALEYYYRNLTGNKSINAMYYIGDNSRQNQYDNNEGSVDQKNKAHLIEMLAALSVVDYMGIPNGQLITDKNGNAEDPIYKEYGLVGGDLDILNFNHLGNETRKRVVKNLIQYAYCIQFWDNYMDLNEKDSWTKDFDSRFLDADFYSRYLMRFNRLFKDWLKEMSLNQRTFDALRIGVDNDKLHTLVNGIEQKKTSMFSRTNAWNERDYVGYLNKAIKKVAVNNIEIKFMDLFYKATEDIYEDRIKI